MTYTGFMTHVTCRLTAKNRDQLRNPTLGNRVWAAFSLLHVLYAVQSIGPDRQLALARGLFLHSS